MKSDFVSYSEAKRLVDLGFSVFPVNLSWNTSDNKFDKKPTVAWKEYQTRFATDKELHQWFDGQKFNGIGIVTGKISNIVVLDVEAEDLSSNIEKYQLREGGRVSSTISGGRHYYYKWEEGITNTVRVEGAKMDIRGEGGFVVAPPSSSNNHRYSWVHEVGWMYLDKLPEQIKKNLNLKGSDWQEVDGEKLEIGEHLQVPQGSRNDNLHRVACSLLNKYPEEEAWEIVLGINAGYQPPLSEKEVLTLFKSAADFVKKSKEEESAVSKTLTDTTNAELIAQLYGDSVRFDHRRNRWLIWKEHRWEPDKNGAVNRLAIKAARQRQLQAVKIEDPDLKTRVFKWSVASEAKGKLEAATGILKNLLPVADVGDGWDQDPMLLSVNNGIIDLTTGKIRAGKAEDRITMSANVEYSADATCQRWIKFLDEVFEENEELIDYIQRALGYSLTGRTTEQAVFFCFGVGSNGKSVMFETIKEIMGDYGYTAPATLFQRNQFNTSSNDVAAIEFKRFLINSEVLSATKINEQRLKKWSGGDEETARYLYSEYFSFHPVCKIWLFVNHKPVVEDESLGFWRRMRLIPFNRVFKPQEQDPDLINKLREERSGILNWLIDGCLMWQEKGLRDTPTIVKEATQLYREESDVLAEFVSQMCEERPDVRTLSTTLYQEYSRWAGNSGLSGSDILSVTKFGIKMTDKFVKKKTEMGVVYEGIGLKSSQSL